MVRGISRLYFSKFLIKIIIIIMIEALSLSFYFSCTDLVIKVTYSLKVLLDDDNLYFYISNEKLCLVDN